MMAKYRRLTIDELKELEKEFVEFLVLNGIVAEDWEKMKEDDPVKADKIIDLFSDVVFEQILRKVGFLDFISAKTIMSFQCLDTKMVMVGMESDSEEIDFTQKKSIELIKTEGPKGRVKVYSQDKAYGADRSKELFNMIQQGCGISDGRWFKMISLLLAK